MNEGALSRPITTSYWGVSREECEKADSLHNFSFFSVELFTPPFFIFRERINAFCEALAPTPLDGMLEMVREPGISPRLK